MPFADLKDFRLFYEIYGAGEPLILIPGFASGAWTWFRQVEDLANDFRVITFDPRGIGKSKVAGDDLQNLSMQTFVEDVLRILDEIKIEKAHILGASFGGFVAQEFALSFPERLNKLILACTTAGGTNHVKPDIEILRSFSPDPTLPIGEKIRRFFRPAFSDEFNRNNADEVELVCRLREENDVAEPAYLAQLQTAFTFDAAKRIGAVANETLIITGDKDMVVPMQNSENLARQIPNSIFKIVENSGHMFFIEKAAEFNRIVTQFVRSS